MATPARGQYYDIAGYKESSIGAFIPVTTTRVTVYVAVPYAAVALTTVASIFSAETGAGTPGNPFNATTGEINFWAAPGSYDIKIEDTGVPAKFANKIIRWDVLPGDKGIITAMVGDGAVGSTQITDGTIVTADLANAAVTAAKIEAQQAWQTLSGGVSGMSALEYMKDSMGFVHFRGQGVTFSSNVVPNPTISLGITLPPNYRPGVILRAALTLASSSPVPYPVSVSTGGLFTLEGNSTLPGFSNIYFLDIPVFKAEN